MLWEKHGKTTKKIEVGNSHLNCAIANFSFFWGVAIAMGYDL